MISHHSCFPLVAGGSQLRTVEQQPTMLGVPTKPATLDKATIAMNSINKTHEMMVQMKAKAAVHNKMRADGVAMLSKGFSEIHSQQKTLFSEMNTSVQMMNKSISEETLAQLKADNSYLREKIMTNFVSLLFCGAVPAVVSPGVLCGRFQRPRPRCNTRLVEAPGETFFFNRFLDFKKQSRPAQHFAMSPVVMVFPSLLLRFQLFEYF